MKSPLLREVLSFISIIIGIGILTVSKTLKTYEEAGGGDSFSGGMQELAFICILFGLILYYKAWNIRKNLKGKKVISEKDERFWEKEDAKWAQEIKNKKQEDIDKEILTKRKRLKFAKSLVEKKQFEKAIEIFGNYEEGIKIIPELKRRQAKYHERLLEFEEAAKVYKELGMEKDAIRVRKLKAKQMTVRVSQKVVHGDYVDDRDTIVKDSVLNRSNVGGGSSKAEELREAKFLLDEGLINENDYEKMKKEILGK